MAETLNFREAVQRAGVSRQRLNEAIRSDRDDWGTPEWVFTPLHAEFGFTLDACAVPENAKCPRYYTPADDGISQDWGHETVWMNPPYGRTIGRWLAKAYEASKAGATVVCLVPGKRTPLWWRTYIKPYASEIRDLDKRIKFVGAKHNAPFDSAVVVFRPPIR
jgi:site-specific DNA-methyltransferase (adenine-specific)